MAGFGRTSPAAICSAVTTRWAVSGASARSSQKLGKKIWYARWVSIVVVISVIAPRLR
jgi:hypothetical protein